jgi:localization factor PodJL
MRYVPWHVKGVRPKVREAAGYAARRSGLSVGAWLNSLVVDAAAGNYRRSLAELTNAVRLLSSKADSLAAGDMAPEKMQHLERALGALQNLASQFASRHAVAALSHEIKALSDKFDRNGGDGRMEELLVQLRELRAENENRLAAIQGEIVTSAAEAIRSPAESIRRDVASLKEIQTSVDRRTQDTFEAVYGTIEQVVDRLAVIENELRDRHFAVHADQLADEPKWGGEPVPTPHAPAVPALPSPACGGELGRGAREDGEGAAPAMVDETRALAPSTAQTTDRAAPTPALKPQAEDNWASMAPTNILPPHLSMTAARLRHPAVPDFALVASVEPGSHAHRVRAAADGIDRIAVSDAMGRIAKPASTPVRAKFVAAARRAARAVVSEHRRTLTDRREKPGQDTAHDLPPGTRCKGRTRGGWFVIAGLVPFPSPASGGGERARHADDQGGLDRPGRDQVRTAASFAPLTGAFFESLRPRAQSVILSVSMVLLMLAALGPVLVFFYTPAGQISVRPVAEIDDATKQGGDSVRPKQPPTDQRPTRHGANLASPTSPVPHNTNALPDEPMPGQAPEWGIPPELAVLAAIPTSTAAQSPPPYPFPQAGEGTSKYPPQLGGEDREGAFSPTRNVLLQGTAGRDSASQSPPASVPDLTATPLPPTIGGKALIAAASAGDPSASYEIAMRFAQGRNAGQDLAMAAAWLDRAGRSGLAPAQFRLGSMYEKGLGVKQDLAEARRLYVAAADKGNAKAMHNLAVLYARGLDGKPDYAAAAQWFRRAAIHGLVDSQYNLAILNARGLGVERNFAESYKWFALAAKGGDRDAAHKRDEVATRLEPKQLESARLSAESFVAMPQPDEATATKVPLGGWDEAIATATTKSKAPVRPERFPGK